MTTTQQMTMSLRRDLPKSVTWSGIPLLPEVDMLFWLERLPGQTTTDRIVYAALVKPGLRLPLQPLRDFDLELLGSDCVRLETSNLEMVVIGNHVRRISAFAESKKIKFLVDVAGSVLTFVAGTGIMGRWDWLVNPAEGTGLVYVQPVPVSQMLTQTAA